MLLGAKYAPCMRRDIQLLQAFEQDRMRENRRGCCVYNAGSGCYQADESSCNGVRCHCYQLSLSGWSFCVANTLACVITTPPPSPTHPTPPPFLHAGPHNLCLQ